MKRRTKLEIAGWLRVLMMTISPFGAYVLGQSTLGAAIVLGLTSGLGAAVSWLSENPYERARRPRDQIEGPS